MQIDTRLKRLEAILKAATEREHNTVVFLDECPHSCTVTIEGVKYQGTKEEINTLLEPYIKGGSVVICGENELKD